MINIKILECWKDILKKEFQKDYFYRLVYFLKQEYKKNICYPKPKNIFSAFNNCPFNLLKVVIIGQDPYYKYNQANGLCFSVNINYNIFRLPPSLNNILKEVKSNIGKTSLCKDGNLIIWSKQGVLLLNSILTVRSEMPRSHNNKGWEKFTNKVVNIISNNKKNIVFLLWGEYAKKKINLININKHYILKSSHPSPLSANKGFFGCNHFSKTNFFLLKKGIKPILW